MHKRREERADQGEIASTQEVAIDVLLLIRELIAGEVFFDKEGGRGGRINCKGRSSSKGEFAAGGSTLCELLRRRALGALISQEDHRHRELQEFQIKLGLWELRRLVIVSIERFFIRFRGFIAAEHQECG